ncbi:MAG TPA: hypothetical protein VN986_05550 [Actinomycetota bacterium]|nr:hypothetical protein [Actinomycetota bacterium]
MSAPQEHARISRLSPATVTPYCMKSGLASWRSFSRANWSNLWTRMPRLKASRRSSRAAL